MGIKLAYTVPEKEYERVLELAGLDLDYVDLNEEFNDLTKLAANIAETDIASISLVDLFTQWTVANFGECTEPLPRKDSIFRYTIKENKPLEIHDLSLDERFKNSGYGKNTLPIKYYYGIPLETKSGGNIGVLCVMGSTPKSMAPGKKEMLRIIAKEVMNRLYSLKKINDLKAQVDEATKSKRQLNHDIRGPVGGIIGLSRIIKEQGFDNNMEEVLEMNKMIHDGGQSVLDLANERLSVKKECENRDPKAYELTLQSLKKKLTTLYTPQANVNHVDLTIVNHSKNEDIPFPKKNILQVTGQLISSAIQRTSKGGMVMVRQEYQHAGSSGSVLLTVKKTEAESSKEKAGAPEQDVIPEINESEDEYSAGLKLVHHLVTKMKGELTLSSKENEGCIWEVKLPVS